MPVFFMQQRPFTLTKEVTRLDVKILRILEFILMVVNAEVVLMFIQEVRKINRGNLKNQ